MYYSDKIFPGVYILNTHVGGKTPAQASNLLAEKIHIPEKVTFENNQNHFELSLQDLALFVDFEKTVDSAYSLYRSGRLLDNIIGRLTSLFHKKTLMLSTIFDHQKLNEYLEVISSQVVSEPTYPEVKLESNKIVVNKGRAGETLDTDILKSTIDQKFSGADFSPTTLPFKKVDPTISNELAYVLEKRAEKLLGKSIVLVSDYDSYAFDQKTLLTLIDPHENFNKAKVTDFIESEIAPKIERLPQNAVFRFEDGKVLEFISAKDGLSIEKDVLAEQLIDTLNSLETAEEKSLTLTIPVSRSLPEVTLNEVNTLGISELLGRGTSKFRGSIPGRIHNISLASSKFNGVLVAPGETFSFNKTLGDVSVFTGYKQAYIIKDGRTVLGDGGGVCQVSTTLFRAILNAGLPVVERRAHSYRVSYYEQDGGPGLDATVFDPTTDLKFTNDTPAHLLIQTQFDSSTSSLVFEIYGTSDGRVSRLTKPVITSSIEPPEDLYVDDPSLPVGTTKQIDYKAWGAKVVFDYSVQRNGENIIEKTFVSNYRPWQAVFLRGTAPPN